MEQELDIKDSTAGSDSGNACEFLPLDFRGCEKMECPLCGSKPIDSTPLTLAASVRAQGKVPWKCTRVFDHVEGAKVAVARKPAGRFDSICMNVFYALGLNEKFSGLKLFHLHVCKPENASQARHFFSCRKQWIQNHNSFDEESVRLKGTGELRQKWTTLTSEHTETFTLEDGGMEFHDIAHWDEQENGKLDRSLVVDRPFCGKVVSGVWVRKGREGVYQARRKDSTSCRRSTQEDDGKRRVPA